MPHSGQAFPDGAKLGKLPTPKLYFRGREGAILRFKGNGGWWWYFVHRLVGFCGLDRESSELWAVGLDGSWPHVPKASTCGTF